MDQELKKCRQSKDLIVNSRGKKYLEFCDEYGLFILNGRTDGDYEGKLTYVGPNGASVNDIAASSYELAQVIKHFKVKDELFSDHFPLCLSLIKKESLIKNQRSLSLLPKLNWNIQNAYDYRGKIASLCENIPLESPAHEIDILTNIIRQASVSSKGRESTYKQKWFDGNACVREKSLSNG